MTIYNHMLITKEQRNYYNTKSTISTESSLSGYIASFMPETRDIQTDQQ